MLPIPFTLRQLQYVREVARTRNFHRAAEACAVAQPSLSAQIAGLEEALGTPLFERGRKGVLLTAAGEALLPRIEALLRDAADVETLARRYGNPLEGPLRLGVIPTLAPYLLPALAPRLKACAPRLMPLWTEDQTARLVAALQAGTLDGAVLALEADLGDLETLPFAFDPFVACLPSQHPLAAISGPLSLSDIPEGTLLLLAEGHCLRAQALAACGDRVTETQGYRATSLSTLVQVVASGLGITLLPTLAAETETRRADVVLRPLTAPAPGRTLGLAWRSGSPLGAPLRSLLSAFRDLPGASPLPFQPDSPHSS